MNIVIPMAGMGSRFSQSGFHQPKPLIQINNKPMYRWAIDCLPLKLASNVIFILRNSDFSDEIEKDIRNNYNYLSQYKIVKIEETQGQAETVLIGSKRDIDLEIPTLIHNCDTYIEEDFEWGNLSKNTIDGAIVLFNSNENRWSYARLDEKNEKVIDFQEKKVISSYASTGTYYFKDTRQLFDSIEYNIKKNIRENNEFYLSTVYRSMLNHSKKIIPLWTKSMMCFGTPQDLVDSLNKILLNETRND